MCKFLIRGHSMSAESRSVLLCKLLVLLLESVARGLAALEGLLHVLDLNGAQLRLDIARFPALVVPVQQPPQRPRGKEGNTEMNCLRELACILCRGAQKNRGSGPPHPVTPTLGCPGIKEMDLHSPSANS